MHLTFRQLETFTEVVRQGSMQRAAEILSVTQPAVSLHIKELEGQVGQRLFDRGKAAPLADHSRGAVPVPGTQALGDAARRRKMPWPGSAAWNQAD